MPMATESAGCAVPTAPYRHSAHAGLQLYHWQVAIHARTLGAFWFPPIEGKALAFEGELKVYPMVLPNL